MPTLVIVPTYNERDSLPGTLARVRAAAPQVDVLVVDDASPDGTGTIADELAAQDDAVHVLHRAGKEGLGAAYRAGFAWGGEHDYDVLVEMDADGSHRPEELPALLERLDEPDLPGLVIGSRWIPGGAVQNWPLRRQVLSRGANLYTRLALGIPVRDATAGFRAYRREVLDSLDLGSVASQGYCFQVDLAWRAHSRGHRVVEVPILFVERMSGTSKMSGAIVREALIQVAVWGVSHRVGQLRRAWTGVRTRREAHR